MARPDWENLQQQFLSEHANSGISPKDWCEGQGLNYSSARRYIKTPAAQNIAQKSAQSNATNLCKIDGAHTTNISNVQETAQVFDLRSYDLNDMQVKFVDEYLIDLNRTAALGTRVRQIPSTSTHQVC